MYLSQVSRGFQQTILRRNLPSTCMPFETLLSSNLLRYRSNDLLKDGNIATKDEGVQPYPPSKVRDCKFQESMKTPRILILSTWVSLVDLQCLLMEGSYIQHSRTTCNMYRYIVKDVQHRFLDILTKWINNSPTWISLKYPRESRQSYTPVIWSQIINSLKCIVKDQYTTAWVGAFPPKQTFRD